MTLDPFNEFELSADCSNLTFSRRSFLRSSGLLLVLQAAQPRGFHLYGMPTVSPASSSSPPSALVAPGCMSPTRTPYPPQLQSIIAKLDPRADDFPSEVHAEQIDKILQSWSSALCRSVLELAGIHGVLSEVLSDPLTASTLQSGSTTALRSSGPLR